MFGFVYEDADVELDSIKSYLDKNNANKIKSGLMILSGGCTMFEIAPYFENLTAFDTNIEQIDLVNNKINLINNNKDIYKNFLENINMNFDKMFKNIRNKEDIINIFGRENLIKNFGSNAVENTSENFAEHFIKVYESQSEYHDFIFNRNMDIKIKNYGFYNENISKIKSVNLKNENIIDFFDKFNSLNIVGLDITGFNLREKTPDVLFKLTTETAKLALIHLLKIKEKKINI